LGRVPVAREETMGLIWILRHVRFRFKVASGHPDKNAVIRPERSEHRGAVVRFRKGRQRGREEGSCSLRKGGLSNSKASEVFILGRIWSHVEMRRVAVKGLD